MIRSFWIGILLLAVVSGHVIAQQGGKQVVITGRFADTLHADTVSLWIWDDFLSTSKKIFAPHRTLTAVLQQGRFSFTCKDITRPVYVTLEYGPARFEHPGEPLSLYLVAPGDSVHVQIGAITPVMGRYADDVKDRVVMLKMGEMNFSGRNAATYQCQYALREAEKAFEKRVQERAQQSPLRTNWTDTSGEAERVAAYLVARNQYFTERCVLLETYRTKLPPAVYGRLLAELYGEHYTNRCMELLGTVRELMRATGCTDEVARAHVLPAYQQAAAGFKAPDVTPEVLANSRMYLHFVVTKARLDQRIFMQYNDPVQWLLKAPAGMLRDRAIALYFTDFARLMKEPDALLEQSLAVVQDRHSRQILEGFKKDSNKGTPAFNFSLPDSSGRLVRLSDFAGKIVFIDFWYTGCGACSQFYKSSLSKVEKAFEQNKDVVFLTICIDKEKEKWMRSVHGGMYTSANELNVVNLYTNGESVMHPLIKHYQIIGYPHQMMIDRKGNMYRSSDLQHRPEVLIPIINEAIAAK